MSAVYDLREIPEDLRGIFVRAEIGLEPTPDDFVAEMVAVFREVRHYTRYLQKEFAPPQNNPALAAAIAAIALYQTELQENQERFGSLAGFTNTIQ